MDMVFKYVYGECVFVDWWMELRVGVLSLG